MTADCSWNYYETMVNECQSHVVHFPINKTENQYTYSVNAILEHYEQYHPKILILATPKNPTGNQLSVDEIQKIATHCRDAIIILDEAYWGFSGTDNNYVKTILNENDKVIFIRSFSKFFGLPGIRMGYSIGGEYFTKAKCFLKRYLGQNQLSLDLCKEALKNIDYYIETAQNFNHEKQFFYDTFK